VYSRDWPAMILALFGKTCITFSFGVLFLYGNELVPTEIRASTTGSASFIGQPDMLHYFPSGRLFFTKASFSLHSANVSFGATCGSI
jgi:hypothetical protein